MTFELTPESERILDAAVASGAFPTRDQALDGAVSLLGECLEAQQRSVPLPALPELLVLQDDGYIAVRGHRIGLHLLLDRYFAGESAEQIQDRFPSLNLRTVAQILVFVEQHREAMRAYLDHRDVIEQLMLARTRKGPSLEELRARWQQKFGKPFVSPCR